MNLEPLLNASLAIQIHVLTVIPAAVLGLYMFVARKGTIRHKFAGRIWMMLMVATAISSFFIHEIRMWGDFSPIHILSVVTIAGAIGAIRAARKRNIRAHRGYVTGMYIGGIMGAGVFTLWPGRIMNKVLLDGLGDYGQDYTQYAILAAGIMVVIAYIVAYRLVRNAPQPRRA